MKTTAFLIGKSTITGPFSIAMFVYQRVNIYINIYIRRRRNNK
jgi:hypothetical protein